MGVGAWTSRWSLRTVTAMTTAADPSSPSPDSRLEEIIAETDQRDREWGHDGSSPLSSLRERAYADSSRLVAEIRRLREDRNLLAWKANEVASYLYAAINPATTNGEINSMCATFEWLNQASGAWHNLVSHVRGINEPPAIFADSAPSIDRPTLDVEGLISAAREVLGDLVEVLNDRTVLDTDEWRSAAQMARANLIVALPTMFSEAATSRLLADMRELDTIAGRGVVVAR